MPVGHFSFLPYGLPCNTDDCIVSGKQLPTATGDAEMIGEESPRFVGRSMQRREDHRLLTGCGQFVADLTLPGMLHSVFVRSQYAHGRIRSIDAGRAAAMPGVVRVLTGAELLRIAPPVAGGQLSLPASGELTCSTPSTIRNSRCWPWARSGMWAKRLRSSWPRAAIRPWMPPSWWLSTSNR
jgi:Aldehyde oxidase and xanthine dehydrogenase, a/b hammerhead domain